MKAVSYIGQETSQLGTNTGPRDLGAPSAPTEAPNGHEVPRFVKLMALTDKIQPDSVSRGSELRRLKQNTGSSNFNYVDGEGMSPVPAPGRKKVAEAPAPAPVAVPTPAAPAPNGANGEAAPRKYAWRERHRVTFKSGFVTVTVPAVSIVVDGPVLMIYTPIAHDTRVEPPRGEEIEMSVRSLEDEALPFDQGEKLKLQSTGIYMDVPVFRSRCGIFFRRVA